MTLPVSVKAVSPRANIFSNESSKPHNASVEPSGLQKFSRGESTPPAGARNEFVRRDVDGGFRGGYQRVPNESPEQQALNRQYLNNALSGLTAATNGISFAQFQHNGQNAFFQQRAGEDHYFVSFNNGHQSSSLLRRIVRPPVSFQFDINPATNQIRQIQGPQQLTPAQTAVALETLTMSFLARPS